MRHCSIWLWLLPWIQKVNLRSGVPFPTMSKEKYAWSQVNRRSEQQINCDAISRLLHEDSKIAGGESEINCVGAIDGDFQTAKDIGKATRLGLLLSRVLDFVLTGWSEKCDEEGMKPYYNRRKKLSCEQNCVLWGSRINIPYVFREKILKELHWEHPGICAMKAIAHTCVWWHKMDDEIERTVKLSTVCRT